MGKKTQIHVFVPEIYPRKLFVIRGRRKEKDITDAFTEVNGDELTFPPENTFSAVTWETVKQRETGYLGVLIWIISDVRPKTLAHEAVHAANHIFKDIGVDMHYDHDEHYAYMVGWIVDCLWQVVTNNFRN